MATTAVDEPSTMHDLRERAAVVAVAVAVVTAMIVLWNALLQMLTVAHDNASWIVQVPVKVDPTAPEGLWFDGIGDPTPLHWTFTGAAVMVEQTDRLTALLAGAQLWAYWVVFGVAILILVPVFRALVAGRRLGVREAWHVLAVGMLVAVGWFAACALPAVATARVLAAGELFRSSEWFAPHVAPTWWPLGIAALFVLLGLALHRGARAAADVEGLV